MSRRTLTTWALCALLAPSAALAHKPHVITADQPFTVPNPLVSWALYGKFSTGSERFVVQLTFNTGFGLPFQILVPHRDGLYTHRPAFAIVGPGLPTPTSAELAALPQPLPSGAGALVELNTVEPRPVDFEDFTRRYFWTSPPVAWLLPKGTYEVWIWAPDHTTGKFTFAFGVEEDVNGLDIKDLTAHWSDYAY